MNAIGTFFRQGAPSQLRTTRRLRDFAKLFVHAGSYYVVFNTDFGNISARADLKVSIVPCPPGHVTGGRDDTCNPCPVGLYSFSALSAQCSVCGANTKCPGGDVIWPVKGWWHSAPHSTQMHR